MSDFVVESIFNNDGEILSSKGKRPIPKVFGRSSDYNDIIYYDFGESPEEKLKQLPEGRKVFDIRDLAEGWKVFVDDKNSLASEKIDNATGMVKVNVRSIPKNPTFTRIDNSSVIGEAGDVLLLTMKVRTASGGISESKTGQICVRIFCNEKRISLVSRNIISGKDIHTEYIAFKVKEGISAADKCEICIDMGHYIQEVEISEFTLTNYENKVLIQDLPSITLYDGIEKNALWRRKALERIDRIRKGDLKISVKDSNGNPISDAEVEVNMTETAFQLGTAINSDQLTDKPENVKNRKTMVSLFNGGVMESETKWVPYERDNGAIERTLDWLRENGVDKMRGHVLVWDALPMLPVDIPELMDDEAALRKRLKEHIFSIARQFEGKLQDWDVINEYTGEFNKNPYHRAYMAPKYGDGLILDLFRWAYEAIPTTPLYINETEMTGMNPPQVGFFCGILDYLNENNVKWDGIGVQGHFGAACNPMRFYKELDTLAKYGKEIKITEFDVNIQNEELQASFTRDLLITMFSHEAVNGIIMWGFTDARHWLSNAVIFKKDWTYKKSGEQFIDLFYNKFWTYENGRTNNSGEYSLRAFYGDYEIKVRKDGEEYICRTSCVKGEDNCVEIVLG